MVFGLGTRLLLSWFEQNEGSRLLLGSAIGALVVHIVITVRLNRSVAAEADTVPSRIVDVHCWADVLLIAWAHVSSLRLDSDQHLGLAIPLLTAALFLRFDRTVKVLALVLLVGIVLPVVLITMLLHIHPGLKPDGREAAEWWHILVCNLGPRIAFWCIAEVPIWWLIHRNRLLKDEAGVFKLLAERVPFAVFRKDTDARFVYANPVLTRELGRSEAEMIGRSDAELGLSEAKFYRESDEAVLSGRQALVDRLEPNYAPHSPIKKVRTVKVRLDDEIGKVAGLVGICYEAVSEEEVAFYRRLLSRTPHAMFQKDKDGRFVWVNDAFAEIVDLPKEEILGLTDADLYPEELARIYRACDAYIIRNKEAIEGEEPHRFADSGETRWVRVLKGPILGDDGQVTGVMGSFWDIHESRLEDDRIRGWFAMDGNRPVHFLREQVLDKLEKQFSEIAQRYASSPAGASPPEIERRKALNKYLIRPTLEIIQHGIDATDLLFAQFDALAILRDGATPENLVWTDRRVSPEVILNSQQRLFKLLWPGVELEVDCQTEETVLTDHRKLVAVFWVMVENAIHSVHARYAERDVCNGGIQVSLTSEVGYLELAVTDNGIGFSEDEEAAIRDGKLFKFSKPSGCGFRLLQRMADLSGGDWDILSEGPGRGATGWFRWPSPSPNSSPPQA